MRYLLTMLFLSCGTTPCSNEVHYAWQMEPVATQSYDTSRTLDMSNGCQNTIVTHHINTHQLDFDGDDGNAAIVSSALYTAECTSADCDNAALMSCDPMSIRIQGSSLYLSNGMKLTTFTGAK